MQGRCVRTPACQRPVVSSAITIWKSFSIVLRTAGWALVGCVLHFPPIFFYSLLPRRLLVNQSSLPPLPIATSLSHLHAQLVSCSKSSNHRPSQKMWMQFLPQRLPWQPTLTQASSCLPATRNLRRSPQRHYTRSVIALSFDHGTPDHSQCL